MKERAVLERNQLPDQSLWRATRELVLDDINTKDLGGVFRFVSELANTTTDFQVQERNLAPTETQEPNKPQVSTIIFNKPSNHLDMVEKRQQEFDLELGNKRPPGQFLSYEPVFDRVNYELAQTNEQKESVKKDMEKELNTNLRERYRTALNVVTYLFDNDGNVFSEDDPSVPIDIKFQNGASYRIAHGSPEPERELQTVAAGIIAKNKLAQPDTPLYEKAIVASPPGAAKGTAYQDNFVNIYELTQDPQSGKRIIKMHLFASSLNTEEYNAVLTKLRPDFFAGKIGAFDVQCLDPIFIDPQIDGRTVHEIFNQEFRSQKEVTSEENFQEILSKASDMRQNYIEVVCGKVFNPREIALAFNAFLNKADAIRREIINRGKGLVNRFRAAAETVICLFKDVKEEALHWGQRAVEQLTGGCGLSGGFSLGGGGIINSIRSLVSGVTEAIVGASGGSLGKDKDYCIRCGACGKEIRCVVRKGESCPKCQAVRQC